MDANKISTIAIGAVIAILGATGFITADEGTSLSGYGISTATGIIGLVEIIRGIIQRKKDEKK